MARRTMAHRFHELQRSGRHPPKRPPKAFIIRPNLALRLKARGLPPIPFVDALNGLTVDFNNMVIAISLGPDQTRTFILIPLLEHLATRVLTQEQPLVHCRAKGATFDLCPGCGQRAPMANDAPNSDAVYSQTTRPVFASHKNSNADGSPPSAHRAPVGFPINLKCASGTFLGINPT
jgi:hypothetical protein